MDNACRDRKCNRWRRKGTLNVWVEWHALVSVSLAPHMPGSPRTPARDRRTRAPALRTCDAWPPSRSGTGPARGRGGPGLRAISRIARSAPRARRKRPAGPRDRRDQNWRPRAPKRRGARGRPRIRCHSRGSETAVDPQHRPPGPVRLAVALAEVEATQCQWVAPADQTAVDESERRGGRERRGSPSLAQFNGCGCASGRRARPALRRSRSTDCMRQHVQLYRDGAERREQGRHVGCSVAAGVVFSSPPPRYSRTRWRRVEHLLPGVNYMCAACCLRKRCYQHMRRPVPTTRRSVGAPRPRATP